MISSQDLASQWFLADRHSFVGYQFAGVLAAVCKGIFHYKFPAEIMKGHFGGESRKTNWMQKCLSWLTLLDTKKPVSLFLNAKTGWFWTTTTSSVQILVK